LALPIATWSSHNPIWEVAKSTLRSALTVPLSPVLRYEPGWGAPAEESLTSNARLRHILFAHVMRKI
jgi:hypothetical protein